MNHLDTPAYRHWRARQLTLLVEDLRFKYDVADIREAKMLVRNNIKQNNRLRTLGVTDYEVSQLAAALLP